MDTAGLCIPALAIVLFPLLTTAAVDPCNCLDLSLEERSLCGPPGISFDQCKSLGCCYDARFSNSPFCYVNTMSAYQQQLQLAAKEKERKELEEFCRKCNEGGGGIIFGFISGIFGSNKPAECSKCERRTGLFRRKQEDPTN